MATHHTKLRLIYAIFRTCEAQGIPIPAGLVREAQWHEVRLEIDQRANRRRSTFLRKQVRQLNEQLPRDPEYSELSTHELAAKYGIRVIKNERPPPGTPVAILEPDPTYRGPT